MSVDAGPIPSRHERPDRTRYPPVTTDTARNAGPTPTVAVRSVLIHDQRAAAREAITHAVTAAIPSVTHITCVADASDLATTFAGTPADLVFIGLHDATAGTVHAVELFLQRHPSASVIVLGGVDDTTCWAQPLPTAHKASCSGPPGTAAPRCAASRSAPGATCPG